MYCHTAGLRHTMADAGGHHGQVLKRLLLSCWLLLSGVNDLPAPLDSRVVTRELAPTCVAALRFGGIPLDFEVTAAERRLRAALLRDGLEPKAGYRCVAGISRGGDGWVCLSLLKRVQWVRMWLHGSWTMRGVRGNHASISCAPAQQLGVGGVFEGLVRQ